MRLRSLILTTIKPQLEKVGFSLCHAKSEYLFSNRDNSQHIIFDTEKGKSKRLRVLFQVMSPNSFSFYSSYLAPSFCRISGGTYQTQEEFDNYVENLITEIVRTILPYMNTMSINAVSETHDMCLALSQGTKERAIRFSNKWKLTLNNEPSSNLEHLDSIIQKLQTDITNRRIDFMKNTEEIIDMAAYFGCLISVCNGEDPFIGWHWREINPGEPVYVISNGYDPLERIIAAWNHGLEVINYSLKYFPL